MAKTLTAEIVSVSHPFTFSKKGVDNSCIKMLIKFKDNSCKILTFILEAEYLAPDLTSQNDGENLSALTPFIFASLCEKGDILSIELKEQTGDYWRACDVKRMENQAKHIACV